MGENFKEDIGVTPSLTFDTFDDQVNEMLEVKEEKKESQEYLSLTESERKMVDDFVDKIDLNNSNSILQYGVGAQKKIADFSESALNNVKTKDLGEVGNMLSSVVVELKNFEDTEEKKGLLGIFKKQSKKIDMLKAKYTKVESNINTICTALEEHQIQLLKDISMLDKMYEINKVYFKELNMYILAGKKRLEKARERYWDVN